MKGVYYVPAKFILVILLCFIAGHVLAVPVITGITRHNQCDGLIVINATGSGTLFYAIKKTTDANYSSRQTSNRFEGLTTGTYKVMVYDNTGQTELANITVDNKNILTVTSPPEASTSVISCAETGRITIKAQKGSSPYTYQIVSGPVTRDPMTFNSCNNQSFESLPTGIYSVSITDACGTVIYLNDIHVISNNLKNKTLTDFELGGPVTYAGYNGCGISFTRNINYVNLKAANNEILYGFGSGRTIPAGSNIPARLILEYSDDGSTQYTNWGSITNYSIPATQYKPGKTSYRIQIENPCISGNTVTSQVYQLPNPYDWQRTVCGYELFRNISGYSCGNVILELVNGGSTTSITWSNPGSATSFDFTNLSAFSSLPAGTYQTYITVNGSRYQTANLVKGATTYMDPGLVADVYNYPTDMSCNFSTVGIRTTKLPSDNTISITYTIVSGPVSRSPITTTQNTTLWSDLPQGTYRIRVNRGVCGVDEHDVTVQPPFSGFNATVSFQAGYTCGWYKITGTGWYLDPSGNVSGTDEVYGVAVFNASNNILVGTASNVTNNTPFVTDVNIEPGTYRVRFSLRAPTNTCYYLERYITIPASELLAIDPETTGGLVCSNGRGTLHVGIKGGNGQPVTYRIRDAAKLNESDYSRYQSSPDFSDLAAGKYTVQINNGCETDTWTIELKGATSEIKVTGSLCEGSEAVLKLQVVGVISDAQWTLSGKILQTGQTLTIPRLAMANSGTYSVSFNSGGCAWNESTELTVKSKPEFSFTADTIACQAINLKSLTSTPGSTSGLFLEYFNESYQPVTNPTEAGNGIYHIVGTTTEGCSDTTSISVTINSRATDLLISASPVNVCSGTQATVKAAALKTAGIVNPVIRWYADQASTNVLYTDTVYTVGTYNIATTTTYTWYASVSGDNYCENLPGTRKVVTLTVHPKPTVTIQTSQDINNVCHTGTIALNAVVTGNIIWYGWYDINGSQTNTAQFAPDPNAQNVVYNPDISEAGKTSKLYVRVHDQVCGYIADTIKLQILPLPAVENFELTVQPVTYQEMCTDTVYEVKMKAGKRSDLYKLQVKFADINATAISIKEAYIKHPYTSGNWELLNNISSDNITGKTWDLPNPLLRGDSTLIRVKVAAECGFYSGANMALNLNAQSVCGDKLSEQTVLTKTFYTKQDEAQLNTYEITSSFSPSKVTNNTSDTVTWRLQAVVHGNQPTNAEKEAMFVLVPAGFSFVSGSYKPIQNAPIDISGMEVDPTEFGAEIMLPIVGGLTEGKAIIAEFKFTTTGAPCKDYHFYSEVVFSDEVNCGGKQCVFHSTRGGFYPTLTVERYNINLDGNVSGQTVNNLWSGNFNVKTETPFYAGDTIYVDFYIDRNSNMQPDTLVKSFTRITIDRDAQSVFTATFDSVPVEPQKQLLAHLHGDALCSDVMISVAVFTGIDKVCEQDTTLYETVAGMNEYKFNVDIIDVDGVSGATPVRIPLEGSTAANYINENVVRVVWKKKGTYKVWTQYHLPIDPPKEIGKTYFPVTVNELPIVKLAQGVDTTICIGADVDLSRVFRETTGIGTLSYYLKGSKIPLTGPVVSPSDTTVYTAFATCTTGCTSLDSVDFTVNVNRMPQIGSISVNEQPDCGTNTGSIKVIVMGGSSSYTYSLNGNAETVLPPDGVIGNLPVGDYRVSVKNRAWGGCAPSISEMVSLTPSSNGLHASALTTDATNCTSANGSIQLTVNGGTPPYRYRVDGESLSPLPANGIIGSNFVADNYNVTILDVTNCATTAGVVQVKAATGLDLTLTQIKPANCNTEGTLRITLGGGTAPYSYRLSGKGWVKMTGATADIALGASVYEIFAKDAAGCETSGAASMENVAGLSILLDGVTDATCNGVGEGSVRLKIAGDAPLKVSYDGGHTQISATEGIITVEKLKPGVYHFLLTDGNGCTATLEGVRVDEEVDFLQAVDNQVYTYVNRPVSGYITYNDYEHHQQTLTVIGYSYARNGFADVEPDGAYNYEPNQDYVGKDSVQYSIKNPCGFISTAWLYIHVLDSVVTGNRPPIAIDDEYMVKEGESLLNFDVAKNDIDPDGDPLSMPVVVTQVLRGTLTQNPNGTFDYTPNPNFVGVDGFTYRICDDKGACSMAQAHITVLPAAIYDQKIIALPDAYSVAQYDTLRVTNPAEGILANDIYPTVAIPKIVIVEPVANGTLDEEADGTFTYTPFLDYAGFDGFTYALCADNMSIPCDTAWVSIFVAQRPCTLLHGTYTVGNVPGANFATLKDAADSYNNCGIQVDSRLVIVSDLTETGTVEFKGSAPGSSEHTLIIVSDGTRRTISGSIDGPLVKLTGANNIIIDGQQTATEAELTAPLLSFVNTYATAHTGVASLRVDKAGTSSGKHVRIRHAEFSLVQQQMAATGVYAAGFSTDSVFVQGCYFHHANIGLYISGNKHADIRDNIVTTVESQGIYIEPASSAKLDVVGNITKDFTSNSISIKMTGIYVDNANATGQWNILNNRVADLNNTGNSENTLDGIKISGNANMKVNNNVVENLTNKSTSTGFALHGINVTTRGSATVQMDSDTVRNLTSESYAVAFSIQHGNTATSTATVKNCYAGNVNGKGMRLNMYNSIGIYVMGQVRLEANTITGIRNTAGSSMGISMTGSNVHYSINNMVSDVAGKPGIGISVSASYSSLSLALYHNTVRLTSKLNDADEATVIDIGDRIGANNPNVRISNNIFSNEVPNGPAQNFIIKQQPGATINSMNTANNCYRLVNGNVGMVVTNKATQTGTVYAKLPAWANVSSDNSMMAIPVFASTTNLHLAENTPSLQVPLIGSVAIDFDGDARDKCRNAAGADNFTATPTLTFSQPTVTYAKCIAKVAFETTGGVPAFQYNLNKSTTYSAATVDSVTMRGTRAVHFDVSVPVTSGTHNYTFGLRDVNGCIFTTGGLFLLTAYPAPVIEAVSNACVGDRVIFDTGTDYNEYQWTITVGLDGNMEVAEIDSRKYITWSAAGAKTVTATITDANGCKKTGTKNIVIYPKPEPGPAYRVPNRN